MTNNDLLSLCDSLIRIAPDSAPGIVAAELKRRLTEPSEREKALLVAARYVYSDLKLRAGFEEDNTVPIGSGAWNCLCDALAAYEEKEETMDKFEVAHCNEFAWLIEREAINGPVYLTVHKDLFDWTRDSTEAIRFSRRQDAEMVARVIGDEVSRVAEHGWYQLPVESTKEGTCA